MSEEHWHCKEMPQLIIQKYFHQRALAIVVNNSVSSSPPVSITYDEESLYVPNGSYPAGRAKAANDSSTKKQQINAMTDSDEILFVGKAKGKKKLDLNI